MRAVLLVCVALCVASAFETSDYPNSHAFTPDYTIYWRLTDPRTIRIALQARTAGWVGFGIGEQSSGSMPGADMVIGSVSNGVATVKDYYATEYDTPHEDTCQDWKLISGEEVNGITTIEVERAIELDNAQDRSFVGGRVRVVWAMGNSDTLSYHSSRRGMDGVYFLTPEVPAVTPGTTLYEARMDDILLPAQKTLYMCKGFTLPHDKPYHIVQVEPVVDPRTVQHVHHFILHLCSVDEHIAVGQEVDCHGPDSPMRAGNCTNMVFGWAYGGTGMTLPDAAGFMVANTKGAFYQVLLEIHYDNPAHIEGMRDSSGVAIYYTDVLRPNNAGVLMHGVADDTPIPAHSSLYEVHVTCPSQCTQHYPHPITVFSDGLHMHKTGRRMWGTQWRGSEYLGYTNRIEYYEFNAQSFAAKSFVIQPGDTLHTHCMYTNPSDTPVRFGSGSDDEMCFEFLVYYPAMYNSGGELISQCGLYRPHEQPLDYPSATYCDAAPERFFADLPNPSSPDMTGQDVALFGQETGPCNAVAAVNGAAAPTSGGSAVAVFVGLPLIFIIIGGSVYAVYYRHRKRTAGYTRQQQEDEDVVDLSVDGYSLETRNKPVASPAKGKQSEEPTEDPEDGFGAI